MMAIRRISSKPYAYKVEEVPVSNIANQNRLFPKEWILSPFALSKEFHDYLKPLVQGGIDVKLDEDGSFLAAEIKR